MRLNEFLGIKYPIIQGGMANIALGEFAAAVSNAGGLGLIASGGFDAERIREEIKKCRALTDKPFGVNLMLMNPDVDNIAKMLVEEKVDVITTGAGSPEKYVADWKAVGTKVIPVVSGVALAKRMERMVKRDGRGKSGRCHDCRCACRQCRNYDYGCICPVTWYCDSEFPGGRDCLYAVKGRRYGKTESISVWYGIRRSGAGVWISDNPACSADDEDSSVFPVFCSWCDDLCCCGGTDPGSTGGRAYEYRNDRDSDWLCVDDGARCSTWINVNIELVRIRSEIK